MIVSRACPDEIRGTPEGKLWLAAIGLALIEADNSSDSGRAARRFLLSRDCELVCDIINLNPIFMQELIRDHASWMRRAA